SDVCRIDRGPAIPQPHVAAVGPTQFLQALQECSDAGKRFRIVRGPGQQQPDAAHPFRLLRVRRERPRRRAAEKRYELAAAAHSITSSAMASSPGGMVRPSALAVLRLITNSNLVDCTTGRSAGLAPLRMRPA